MLVSCPRPRHEEQKKIMQCFAKTGREGGAGEGGREGGRFFHLLWMFFICGVIQDLCNTMGGGGVNFPDKKHYEGVYSSKLLVLPGGD